MMYMSLAWLWKQADTIGDFTIDALTEKLCEEYEVPKETALQDVTTIVEQWQKEGVVE